MKRIWTLLVGGFLLLASSSAFPQAIDSDNDGLPDDWEAAYGLSASDPADAAIDSNGDGIINLLEYAWGGDPRVNDPAILPQWSYDGTFSIIFNRRLNSRFSIVAEQTDSL